MLAPLQVYELVKSPFADLPSGKRRARAPGHRRTKSRFSLQLVTSQGDFLSRKPEGKIAISVA